MLHRKLALAAALTACSGMAGAAMTADIRNQIAQGLEAGSDIGAVLLQAIAMGATLPEAQQAAAQARPELADQIAAAGQSMAAQFEQGLPMAGGTPVSAVPGSTGGSGGGGGNAILSAEEEAEQAQQQAQQLQQQVDELEEQLSTLM